MSKQEGGMNRGLPGWPILSYADSVVSSVSTPPNIWRKDGRFTFTSVLLTSGTGNS